MYLYACNYFHKHSACPCIQFTVHKNFNSSNKVNKKVSCKNIHKCRDGAASPLKWSTCTNTPHWQQKSRYKERVPCQSDNPQPLQVTIHRLQETLHTLHPGQHSQASRHFVNVFAGTLLKHNYCKVQAKYCFHDQYHLYWRPFFCGS